LLGRCWLEYTLANRRAYAAALTNQASGAVPAGERRLKASQARLTRRWLERRTLLQDNSRLPLLPVSARPQLRRLAASRVAAAPCVGSWQSCPCRRRRAVCPGT